MQTNKISKWAALLAVMGGMAALPLTVTADTKVVNNVTMAESGSTYTSVSGTSALYVYNPGASYSGTNIALSSTVPLGNNNGRYGALVEQGTLELYNSTVTVSGSDYNGIVINGGGTGRLENLLVNATGAGQSRALYVGTTSSATVIGGTYAGLGEHYSMHANTSSTLTLRNATVIGGANTPGVLYVQGASTLDMIGGTVTDTATGDSFAISINQEGSVATIQNTVITSVGSHALRVENGAVVTVSGGSITATGTGEGSAIRVNGRSDTSLTINNTDIISEQGVLNVSTNNSGTQNVTISGGSITSNGDSLIHTSGSSGGELNINLDGVTVSGSGNITTGANDRAETNINVNGGNGIVGDVTNSGSGNLNLNLNDSSLTGNSNNTSDGTLNISGSNSVIIGDVTGSGSSNTNVNLDNSTLTGNTTANDDSTINISGSNGGTITGDVNANDDANVSVNLDDSTLTGNITGSGSSNIIITGSNGSIITGTATGNDNANLDITVSGPGSSWLGDVNQNDDSKITINIDNGATGTGGFNGGDLNVNGGDSSFNFDKDSHVNNGKNDGTLNIGDHEVEFDNLTNNGKIIINVNSDDQSHGKLDVTGTASGTGNINVNVTGSTAVSDSDRDNILNDLFDHNAKDAWHIDDIDWGLIVVSPTTAPDGSIYSRPNGKLSEAGNIATGLIAAQKSSWFAQQNSLLKRMGELRLQNRVDSVTISGKEDKEVAAPMLSADKLIENVWIRSYGQQLNYGASVTGQAFKQYVYGVDVGTDHKWQLDADNQLFAGVFLGYGAADTDHRHHGSKSEISNYYAGLYASWLNVDGWYLDATLKAQYTNNSLDGYTNGIEYFNGSYNNWSVGGSLEFGKQIKFKDDWFVEPQLQANYLHILASDYTMSQGLNVNVSDLDAFQLRFGIVAGKTLKLKNGGALQPYFKISGVEMVSTGGKISAMGNTVRPNLDGARAELGAGIIWQLDAHNQLHLDYEASFGDKYDKPWGLTAGYRYQF